MTISWSTLEEPQALAQTEADPLPLPTIIRTQNVAPVRRTFLTQSALTDDALSSSAVISATSTCIDCSRISMHHNLVVHSSRANPQLDGTAIDIRNNVYHDFNQAFTHQAFTGRSLMSDYRTGVNVVGNYYQDRAWQGAGVPSINDSFTNDPNFAQYYTALYDGAGPAIPWVLAGLGYSYHISNNYVDGVGLIADPWASWNSWSEADRTDKYARYGFTYAVHLGQQHIEFIDVNAPVTTHTPAEAYDVVLLEAGAQPRDLQTQRVVRETRHRSGWIGRDLQWIDTGIVNETAPLDSDLDGVPDQWELENGFDPFMPDSDLPYNDTGYTVIEAYVHQLAKIRLDAARTPSTDTARYVLTVVSGRCANTAADATELALERRREEIEGNVVISAGYFLASTRVDITAVAPPSAGAFDKWGGYTSVLRRPDLPITFLLMPAANITIIAYFDAPL